jgi:hypothetical protein
MTHKRPAECITQKPSQTLVYVNIIIDIDTLSELSIQGLYQDIRVKFMFVHGDGIV